MQGCKKVHPGLKLRILCRHNAGMQSNATVGSHHIDDIVPKALL